MLALIQKAQEELVVAEQAEKQNHLLAQQLLAQPTLEAVVVEALLLAQMELLVQQAAPASSSFPTLWRPALRSSSKARQRGLRLLVRRRWITLSSAVVVAVDGLLLVAAAVEGLEPELLCL